MLYLRHYSFCLMQGEVIVTLKFYNTVFCELAEIMANKNVDLNLKFLSMSLLTKDVNLINIAKLRWHLFVQSQ